MGIETVLVAGAGALGSLYGHKFIQKKNTWFLANGERKLRLEKEGIFVNGSHYNIKCLDNSAANSVKPDFILIAVKYNNLPEVIDQILPFITKNTIIASVMNGIDSEEIIRKNTDIAKIILSVPIGMDAVRDNNSTTYTKEGKIVFNKFDSVIKDKDIEDVKKLFDECNILSEIATDIDYEMWFKFMINTGVNQVSAILNANYGFIQRNSYVKEIMDSLMVEVINIANAKGIHLSKSDINKWYAILDSLGPEGKTSMCQDMQAGRKTEVEMFSGKIIALGAKYNIDVTINKVLYNLIKAKESLRTQGFK